MNNRFGLGRAALGILLFSLMGMAGGIGCGGMAYLTAGELCTGPYCDTACDANSDCPSGTGCTLGRCSTTGNAVAGGQRPANDGSEPTGSEPGDADVAPSGGDSGRSPAGDDMGGGGDHAPAIVLCEDVDIDGDRYCDCPLAWPDCDCCPFGTEAHCTNGATLPTVNPGALDLCDGLDNNCNGETDENTEGLGCTSNGWGGDGDGPLPPPGSGDDGVVQDPDGAITLDTTDVKTDFAWPSNDPQGTISRVDTITNREVGRYVTSLDVAGLPAWDKGNARPSRSTVDLAGNAYVANRAHTPKNLQGSVTKVGLFNETLCAGADISACPCVDRGGAPDGSPNGQIETSRDVNDDGRISTNLAQGEFLGLADECVLWTVPIPGSASRPRSMAIDRDGFIWVGDDQYSRFYKLDVSGAFVDPDPDDDRDADDGIVVAGRPYGAVIDGKGTLWYLNSWTTGQIQGINTSTGKVLSPSLISNTTTNGYGITIDRKNRVWVASYQDLLGAGTVGRYDPTAAEPTWQGFSAGFNEAWTGRGITATAAGTARNGTDGLVWAAFHHNTLGARLVAFNDKTGDVENTVDLSGAPCNARTSIGVGIGAGGAIWTVNQGSNNMCKYDPKALVDPVSAVPIGSSPYTYSDFTGNILRTFTSPLGRYRLRQPACAPGFVLSQWRQVTWVADTPGESSLKVEIRVAGTAELLAEPSAVKAVVTQPPDSSYQGPWFSLGGWIELRFTLESGDDNAVPTLRSVTIARDCVPDGSSG